MRKTLLSYMNNKGADQPAHPHSLNSAFVVRCLDSNEYSTKLHTSTGSYVQPVRCGKRFIITCTSVSLSFTLQERFYTDFVYLCIGVDVDCLCSIILIKEKKKKDFVTFGTQMIELIWTLKSKLTGIHL